MEWETQWESLSNSMGNATKGAQTNKNFPTVKSRLVAGKIKFNPTLTALLIGHGRVRPVSTDSTYFNLLPAYVKTEMTNQQIIFFWIARQLQLKE